jgi:hexosaminidase
MRLLLAFLLLSSQVVFAANQPSIAIIPQPASVQTTGSDFQLANGFTVSTPGFSDARLHRAIDRAVRRIEARSLPLLPRSGGPSLIVDCKSKGSDIPQLGDDESYTLEVTSREIALRSKTVVGAIRGLETLVQLVTSSDAAYILPGVVIKDQPRFPWRGLHIDVSRHFEPVEVLKRNIDAMAVAKLNVFHWHLTDDQGFRIESKVYPKLTGMGSDGLFYTQDEARDLIAYAADRGIRVMPEFDMPGHTTAWMVGHPELASGPGPYQIERRFGIFDPTMDPSRDSTFEFLDKFIGEMAKLFPDEYIHIGGDENNGKQWSANADIQAFMKKKGIANNVDLQTYFSQRVLALVKKHGKKMVGWDEVLAPGLPKDVVVQSWRGATALDQGAKDGYNMILSQPYYFDAMFPASRLYAADPVPANTSLTPEQQKHVLGGEGCMWAEVVTLHNIDSRIWPRNLAIAERFWSPQSVTDVNDYYRRAATVSPQLELVGLKHLSSLNTMVRAASGSSVIAEPVATLAKYVEPYMLWIRERDHSKAPTQLWPLNGLEDAVYPDQPVGREIAVNVDRLLNDPSFNAGSAELQAAFNELAPLDKTYPAAVAGNPLLEKSSPRANDLAELGRAGLEALNVIRQNQAVPPNWLADKLALINRAHQPTAMLNIAWLPSFQKLVYIAAYRSGYAPMTSEQWKAKVISDSNPKREEE